MASQGFSGNRDEGKLPHWVGLGESCARAKPDGTVGFRVHTRAEPEQVPGPWDAAVLCDSRYFCCTPAICRLSWSALLDFSL